MPEADVLTDLAPGAETLTAIANRLRRQSIIATTEAGSGHPTTCVSCAEIMLPFPSAATARRTVESGESRAARAIPFRTSLAGTQGRTRSRNSACRAPV